ncbi:phage late control D family protein [Phaeobacter inhibens]|uniref:phage late control D family protein n=1 Tax=Phaeobacter inhibens TaxID=221822 RepID=UPI000C9CA14B|nr:contractile injection system protein, VgrG/Pvc8 family [Phaeobacter inhibens]AUR06981.1 phage late control gene D protein (GPD) [Phaeobacter inhibens]
MTHPIVDVTVDGVPVSGAFFNSLVKLVITDREGIRSDTLEMVFNDAPPHFQSPRRGAVVNVSISYRAEVFSGSYVVDRVEYACLPYEITVKGHSADLRAGMKTNKTKHWDNVSVKSIVQEKAADHGLEAKISDAVSGHVYDWFGQQDETDLHFLERLARLHGALFTIKNGTLLWLERGKGVTADGTVIPPVPVLRPSVIKGTLKVSETDVDRYAKVKCYWQDRKGAKRQEVVVDADPEASGEHTLRTPFGSKAEAEAAAKAAAREMIRGLIETSCSIEGRPGLNAGQIAFYAGVRPLVDEREFILDLVTHTFTKSGGLRTAFTGKLKAQG